MRVRSIVGTAAAAIMALTAVYLVTRPPEPYILDGVDGPWRDSDGHLLPDGTSEEDNFALAIHVDVGDEHCGWQDTAFMRLSWPPGSAQTSHETLRQFARDEGGVLSDVEAFEARAQTPSDIRSTGLHTDDAELWVAPSDAAAVYIRQADDSFDRWPRVNPPRLCE